MLAWRQQFMWTTADLPSGVAPFRAKATQIATMRHVRHRVPRVERDHIILHAVVAMIHGIDADIRFIHVRRIAISVSAEQILVLRPPCGPFTEFALLAAYVSNFTFPAISYLPDLGQQESFRLHARQSYLLNFR